MRIYAHLLVALAGRDVDAIAAGSGVAADAINAAAERGTAMDLADRERLGVWLGIPHEDLFRVWALVGLDLVVDLEPVLADAPSRYVTDPATLRTIDRRGS